MRVGAGLYRQTPRAVVQTHRARRFTPLSPHSQWFSHTSRRCAVKPFLLADIGEGIREVQIIQWFVQPGARVEQFDKLCEVQSDKASVEITSRFDGVIKKLHYDADDMAIVGKPLVDIDIQGELSAEDEAAITPPEEQGKQEQEREQKQNKQPSSSPPEPQAQSMSDGQASEIPTPPKGSAPSPSTKTSSGKHATLATPAVRRVTRELDIDIEDVPGTGKDGRVLKEDVHTYASSQPSTGAAPTSSTPSQASATTQPSKEDYTQALTPIQSQMHKTMTRSLNIPHFLYSDTFDLSSLTALRKRLNAGVESPAQKLSALAFILKAVSLALVDFPILNARLDTATNPSKPQLLMRAAHHIGVAVDTPSGLLVPVVKNVQALSIAEIAAEIRRLGELARANKLSTGDFRGGTFSVSNVGSIGGQVTAPVIVEGQMGIVAIGKGRIVPAFDEQGNVVRREECTMSWSADHRVIDGAMVARAAEGVRRALERPEEMVVRLR